MDGGCVEPESTSPCVPDGRWLYDDSNVNQVTFDRREMHRTIGRTAGGATAAYCIYQKLP
eukprot:8998668-Pyramimonas_sp.AAC.2